MSLSQPGVLFNPLNEELVTRGRERGGVPFSVLISRILNIVPHSLGKGDRIRRRPSDSVPGAMATSTG